MVGGDSQGQASHIAPVEDGVEGLLAELARLELVKVIQQQERRSGGAAEEVEVVISQRDALLDRPKQQRGRGKAAHLSTR